MRKPERLRIEEKVLILTLVVQVLFLVNQTVVLATTAKQTMTASMVPTMGGETLQAHISTDTGRPRGILDHLTRLLVGQRWFTGSWVGAWMVDGQVRTAATVAISITVTGANVASTATVDYYVEARSGANTYRFLEATGQSATVGGAALQASDPRTITGHLQAMGLATTQSWTIDYYVYVKATTTGAVSGETLTSEIAVTKFDSKTYVFDDPGVWVRGLSTMATGYVGSARHTASSVSMPSAYTGYGMAGQTATDQWSSWVVFRNGLMKSVTGFPVSGSFSTTQLIPAGAVIREAHLSVKASASYTSTAQNLLVAIWNGDYWDSSVTYAKFMTCWGQRVGDTPWSTTAWVTDTYYHSPDIVTLVQARFDSQGWGGGDWDRITVFLALDDAPKQYAKRYINWGYSGHTDGPHLYIRYSTYAASWYPLPPLSLASLPITLDVVALSALIGATALLWRENRRKMS
ncbi:MAG: hypothetical protein ABIJ47_01375 [Candidatus Bathyarchaeota archaeon]